MYSDKMKRQIELWEQAQDWIAKNPRIYGKFVELALEKCAIGEKFAIAAITERVRWDFRLWFGRDPSTFKIPNGLRRYIALRMMVEHPEMEAFCTTKPGDIELPEQLIGRVLRQTEDDLVRDPALENVDALLAFDYE